MKKNYWVYILTNKRNGTLYVGVTNNLCRRIYEHKSKLLDGFTEKYSLDKLVHCEAFYQIEDAIYREKCIKKWKRIWKIRLIEGENPDWNDLYEDYCKYL